MVMAHTRLLQYDGEKRYGYRFAIFVTFFFLASTGFPSFRFLSSYSFLLLPFLLHVINRNGIRIPSKVYVAIVFISVFSLLHLLLGHLTVIGSISLAVSVTVGLLSALMMGRSFLNVFVYVMKILAVISLIFWLLLVLIPGAHTILLGFASTLPQMIAEDWIENTTNEGLSLYLYYLPYNDFTAYTSFIRNNGPFYEPGLFSSYLNIALVFRAFLNEKLLSKGNIPLILAILSTCSSAGYVSFMLIIMLYVFMQAKTRYKILSILAFALLLNPVMSLDFMSDKIHGNYENALISSASRFGAIIYHFEKVKLSPFIGYAGGVLPTTRFDSVMTDEHVISPNGLSYLFVFWGIPMAICFYILLFHGLRNISGINKKWLIFAWYITILSTAFSQTITTDLLFLTITSFSITLSKYSYEDSSN